MSTDVAGAQGGFELEPGGPRIHRIDEIPRYWARRFPDREAVRFGERSWTWARLDERADRLARALFAAGIRPGDRIAFFDRNHPACLELIFGAARIGAVVTVVNFRLAPDEIQHLLADSQARALFVGNDLLPIWDAIKATIDGVEIAVVIGTGTTAPGENNPDNADEYERFIADAPPEPQEFLYGENGSASNVGDEPALQLYSSGTTGRPKGVVLGHRSLLAHGDAMGQTLPMAVGGSIMAPMPLFHVGGSSYALFGMQEGQRVVMTRDPTPDAIIEAIERYGARRVFLVPALIGFLVKAGGPAVAALSKLDVLCYGASPMPLPLVKMCLRLLPDTQLVQVYGSTEVAGVATLLPDDDHRDPSRTDRLASAGVPLPGVEIRVVKPGTGEDVEAGGIGEILIRTRQRMIGYWRNEKATGEAIGSDGWLRTGDIGWQDQDGYLTLHDRLKDMIISGGENIYSAEVERVVATHPAIADVAVIGVPHERWGETPRAIVLLADGQEVGEAELIAYCRERLAAYKCPTSMEIATEFPRNATGKILKATLRAQAVS